jgi:hypothetical protein
MPLGLFKHDRQQKQVQKGGFLKRFGKSKVQKQQDSDLSSGNGPSDGIRNATIDGAINVAADTAVNTAITISRDPAVDGVVDPAVDPIKHSTLDASTTTLNQGESSRNQTLWDRAYDSLRQKDPQLVDDYEKLLSKELPGPSKPPYIVPDLN